LPFSHYLDTTHQQKLNFLLFKDRGNKISITSQGNIIKMTNRLKLNFIAIGVPVQ